MVPFLLIGVNMTLMMGNTPLLVPINRTSKQNSLFGMKLDTVTEKSFIVATHLAMKVKDTLLLTVPLMGLTIVFLILQGQ